MTVAAHSSGDHVRQVDLAFSNPHARVSEETPSRLVVDLPDIPGESDSGARVSVELEDGVPTLEASRSLFTSNELYLVRDGDALLLTDHFAIAVERCAPELREPHADELLDHFLFRTVPGTKTYARGVTRLGHGCSVRWNAGSSVVEERREETLERPPEEPFAQALAVAEKALEEALEAATASVPPGAVANLLSGGVDSTLLQALLARGSRSLTAAISSPEFAPEIERALLASSLTGSEHQLVMLVEEDYLPALERFLREVCLPPHHLQSVLLAELFRRADGDKRFLVSAALADGLFGLGGLTWPAAAMRRWGWVPAATRSLVPESFKPRRLRQAEYWYGRVREPVGSPWGHAGRTACWGDLGFLAEVFGTEQVERRLQARLDYVLDLCPFLEPDAHGVDAQLEAAHFVGLMVEDSLSIWRQAAMSHGGYVIAPLGRRKIFESALRFSRRERYRRNGETKPALKELLRRRLPDYDTRMPKLSSGLPLGRFLDSGPLHETPYFHPERYFPDVNGRGAEAYPAWIVWGVLTLAAWHELAAKEPVAPSCSISRAVTPRLQ